MTEQPLHRRVPDPVRAPARFLSSAGTGGRPEYPASLYTPSTIVSADESWLFADTTHPEVHP